MSRATKIGRIVIYIEWLLPIKLQNLNHVGLGGHVTN